MPDVPHVPDGPIVNRQANPWLPRHRERTGRLRLFCFPFAGGGSAVFHGLSQRVRGAVEIAPVLLPGRERRLHEPPFRSMALLVESLERGLSEELAEPYALFGHSLGALVAFELARLRQARARSGPVHLFVSACRAPHALAPRPPIHTLPDEGFLTHVEALGGLPAEVRSHPELMSLLLPALRADFEIYNTYRYEPSAPLDCSITALGGEEDREVPRGDLQAWQAIASGPIATHWLSGGHFFLQREEERVGAIVSARLAAAAGARL
jgi:medium-chain acyl-[acyl-carrier-protein] hydrolase